MAGLEDKNDFTCPDRIVWGRGIGNQFYDRKKMGRLYSSGRSGTFVSPAEPGVKGRGRDGRRMGSACFGMYAGNRRIYPFDRMRNTSDSSLFGNSADGI